MKNRLCLTNDQLIKLFDTLHRDLYVAVSQVESSSPNSEFWTMKEPREKMEEVWKVLQERLLMEDSQ